MLIYMYATQFLTLDPFHNDYTGRWQDRDPVKPTIILLNNVYAHDIVP